MPLSRQNYRPDRRQDGETQDMDTQDIQEFLHRLSALVATDEAEDIRIDTDAGEFENGLANLVAYLTKTKTPVSPDDAATLKDLLVEFKSPTTFADGLVVATGDET